MHLEQIQNQDRLERLLKQMDDPISRMDSSLKDIRDGLDGKTSEMKFNCLS